MIAGRFSENRELLFEVKLMVANGEQFYTEVLLDTGFNTAWLAINSQDLEALEWPLLTSQMEMRTARGGEFFDFCEGLIILEGREFKVPVHTRDELPEKLLGSQWLETMQLVVNKPQGILTLEMVNNEQIKADPQTV